MSPYFKGDKFEPSVVDDMWTHGISKESHLNSIKIYTKTEAEGAELQVQIIALLNAKKIMKNPQIDPEIIAENLARLVSGDLTHIGDAMLEGRTIRLCGKACTRLLTFSGARQSYSIAPKMIRLGGYEYPAPETSAPDHNTEYFMSSPTVTCLTCGSLWRNDPVELERLGKGLIHLTEEAAIAHSKAIILAGGGKV